MQRDDRSHQVLTGTNAEDTNAEVQSDEGAGMVGTILNIGNLSFGAGMLALPYAFEKGGLAVGLLGLGLVLWWNKCCCQLMVEMKEEYLLRLKANPNMPTEPTTYAAVGLMAMGKVGAWLVNASVVITLLGAATAYFINANDLLSDTPLYVGKSLSADSAMYLNTVIYMLMMYPLTLAKSLAPLAKLSVPAVLSLFGGFAVIITLGLHRYGGWPSGQELLDWPSLIGPADLAAFSSFFGVAVFSFGVTLMAYDVQESMANQKSFMSTLNVSLVLIWEVYTLTGGVASIIYMQGGHISDNIMSDSPAGELSGVLLRVFMTMATLFTYPLVMQPVISIVEEGVAMMLGQAAVGESAAVNLGYGAINSSDAEAAVSEAPGPLKQTGLTWGQSLVVRGVLVLLTGIFATAIPMFGVVVSLLGSASISLGSFVLPPLFHLLTFRGRLGPWEVTYDAVLFLVGALTCVITTATTAISVFG
ncbi:unnamed protein product [Discosporangium mesarthrocarpum]